MIYPSKISENVSFIEATKSQSAVRLGIKNVPTEFQLNNMKVVANACFEPLRAEFKSKPLFISSFLRVGELNVAVGGSRSSFHVHGMAIDIDGDYFSHHCNKEIFDFFYKGGAPYTELIWEFGTLARPDWVHVAYNPLDERKMAKRIFKERGRRRTVPFDLY